MNLIAVEWADLFWSQLWQVTALIVVVGALGATVLRRRAHLMYVLWLIVFLKSLTLPVWTSPVGVFSWVQPVSSSSRDLHVSVSQSDAEVSEVVVSRETQSSESTMSSVPVISEQESALSVASVLFTVWAFGVVVFSLAAAGRWLQTFVALRRYGRAPDSSLRDLAERLSIQLGMKRPVRICISDSDAGPMLFGFLRPVVVLPEALVDVRAPDQLQPVLMHELLHARRGDALFGLLQVVSQVVWWFNPLVWWANREANRTCERCCDEETVANLGCRPVEYARSILDALELQTRRVMIPATPGIRSEDMTRHRLMNIMKNSHRFSPSAPRRHWLYAVLLTLLILPGSGRSDNTDGEVESVAVSMSDSPIKLRNQADHLMAAGKWKAAASCFRLLTEKDQRDARAWFMLGFCLHSARELDDAVRVHMKAAEFPQTKPTALYNLACAYALQNKREAALDALAKAVQAGFYGQQPITADPDFASIKDDQRFRKLADAAKPPAMRDVYRQFDFWVGIWDVYSRSGEKVGTNVVTKDEKGFLITEKFTNRGGNTGTSINYYDPGSRQWKQTWVDEAGTVIQYVGGFADSQMSLEGVRTGPNGSVSRSRVSYRPDSDGTIQQRIQRSDDGGKTWRIFFDGRYVRQANEDAAQPS